MKKQVTHVSIHQSSKMLATMYITILFVLFILPISLYTMATTGDITGGLLMLVGGPILYWILFYISFAIGFWVYNLLARRIGGIEFELRDMGMRQEPGNEAGPVHPNRVDQL